MLERIPTSSLDSSRPKGILVRLKSKMTTSLQAGVAALALGAISSDAKAQDIEPSSIQCDFSSSPSVGMGATNGPVNPDGEWGTHRYYAILDELGRTVYGLSFALNPTSVNATIDDIDTSSNIRDRDTGQQLSSSYRCLLLPDGRTIISGNNSSYGISDSCDGEVSLLPNFPEGRSTLRNVGMTQSWNGDTVTDQFYLIVNESTGGTQFNQLHALGLTEDGETIDDLVANLIHTAPSGREITGATGVTLHSLNTDEQKSLVFVSYNTGIGPVLLMDGRTVVAEMSYRDFVTAYFDSEDQNYANLRVGGIRFLYAGAYIRNNVEYRLDLCTFTSTNVDPGPTCSDGFVEIDGVCVCPTGQEQVGEICLDECGPEEIREGETCRVETCEDRGDCEVECGEGEVPNEEGDGCREETCEDRGDCEIECREGEVPNEEGDGCREETCEDRDDCEVECEEGEREEDGVCVEIPCEELGNCSEPTEPEPTEPTEPEPTEPEPTEPEPTEPEPTEPPTTEPTEPEPTEPEPTEPEPTEPEPTEPEPTEPEPPRNSSSKGCSAAPGENQNIPAGAALVLMVLLATQRRREEVTNP